MLCRQNRDGTFTYHRPNLRGRRAHPYRPERDDQPEILVPESQEVVSGDSQESGEVVAGSLPAQEAADSPAHPNPPSPSPSPSPSPDEIPSNSPLTPLDYDLESDPEDEDYYKLTNTATGEVKRFRRDNNGIPF